MRKKMYSIVAGEIKDQYGNEPSTEEIVDALNSIGETAGDSGEDVPLKFTFTVEAGSESELQTYTLALKRQVAMWDFEQELRKIWKYDEKADEETVNRIWELWHESKADMLEDE